MSFLAKRELLARVAPRYQTATSQQKSVILDEFVAATGYARKYAIRLLAHPVTVPVPLTRPRERFYGPPVQDALVVAWSATNRICAKRLVPFLPDLIATLERHGHLTLTEAIREQLLALSPATADRILRPYRERDAPHGMTTTRRGLLIKQQVPVRTFTGWDDVAPGFFEADLVAHCGNWAEGSFLHTLTLTDVATGWTECLPLLYRSQHAVIQAIDRARLLLPMPLLGLDTDNGSEFLNVELLAYCEREQITFTRGRVAKKNDQCYVEQKNGAIVQQLVGYDRFEGEHAYQQLAELYRAVRLYVNFFQPSMKLRLKQREGGRLLRRYDPARTPFQRLLAAGVVNTADRVRLTTIAQALDPVQLLRQIEQLQDALWRHAAARFPVGAAERRNRTQRDADARLHARPSHRNRCDHSIRPARREEIPSDEAPKGPPIVSHAARSVRECVAGSRAGVGRSPGSDGEGDLRGFAGALSRDVPGDATADVATAGAGVAHSDDPGVRRSMAWGRGTGESTITAPLAGDCGECSGTIRW